VTGRGVEFVGRWTREQVWYALDEWRWIPASAQRVVTEEYELAVTPGSYALKYVYGYRDDDPVRVEERLLAYGSLWAGYDGGVLQSSAELRRLQAGESRSTGRTSFRNSPNSTISIHFPFTQTAARSRPSSTNPSFRSTLSDAMLRSSAWEAILRMPSRSNASRQRKYEASVAYPRFQ